MFPSYWQCANITILKYPVVVDFRLEWNNQALWQYRVLHSRSRVLARNTQIPFVTSRTVDGSSTILGLILFTVICVETECKATFYPRRPRCS